MSSLVLGLFFRKGGNTSPILAVALLVAILASMDSVVNCVTYQTQTLGTIPNTGGTFIILNQSSIGLSDSKIDSRLARLLENDTSIKWLLPEKISTVTLTTSSGNYTVTMRSVEDITTFLSLSGICTNGTVAKGEEEMNAGEILARVASINVGDEANITLDTSVLEAKLVGIIRTQTQSDTELLCTTRAAERLNGNASQLSFIEFALKENVEEKDSINNIADQLPAGVKIVKTQQLTEFVQGMNDQTLTFLNSWSIAVYVTVAAASYVISSRLIADFNSELGVLRSMGAKKRFIFITIQTYVVIIIVVGSILGTAVGLAGTQIVSKILTWVWHVEIAPFFEYLQALKLLLLTLSSSILGCIYPALRAARLHQ